jgi:hypothetical protein
VRRKNEEWGTDKTLTEGNEGNEADAGKAAVKNAKFKMKNWRFEI